MSGIYPGATWRPISFADAPPLFAGKPRGWVLHVPVSDGSLFHLFDRLRAPNRRTSTGWVGKGGEVEQYVSALREPWAQVAGNPWGTAWEVEGFPDEPMTDAQLDALARIHIWLGADDTIADSPSAAGGIGTHQMGGAAWGGHACPGPIRAAQRTAILDRVAALRRGEVDMQLDDKVTLTAAQAAAMGGDFKAGDQVSVQSLLIWSPGVMRVEQEMKDRTDALSAALATLATRTTALSTALGLLTTKVDALATAVTAGSHTTPADVAAAFETGLTALRAEVASIKVTVGP